MSNALNSGADRLFVIGVSLEIAGGILSTLHVLLASPREAAFRGVGRWAGSEPARRNQQEAALILVGAVTLFVGFVMQLLGYVVQAGDWAFVPVAAATVIGVILLGRYLGSRSSDGLADKSSVEG